MYVVAAIPTAARAEALGLDLSALEDLVLRSYEMGVMETLHDTNMEYSYSPVKRLVTLYREAGRKAEERALALRYARPTLPDYDPGYAAYRRIRDYLQSIMDQPVFTRPGQEPPDRR